MPKTRKFPQPGDTSLPQQLVFCSAKRVLKLYEKAHPDRTAKKLSRKVKAWFVQQAVQEGWAGIVFVADVRSQQDAGALLALPPPEGGVLTTLPLTLATQVTDLADAQEPDAQEPDEE